jgi:hypothetical protein
MSYELIASAAEEKQEGAVCHKKRKAQRNFPWAFKKHQPDSKS